MEEDKNSLKSIVNKIKSKIHLYWNKIKKFVQYSQCEMHLYCLRIILGMILYIQSNLGLTDKCGPPTVRCWKKSVKRKRSVPHSVTS